MHTCLVLAQWPCCLHHANEISTRQDNELLIVSHGLVFRLLKVAHNLGTSLELMRILVKHAAGMLRVTSEC